MNKRVKVVYEDGVLRPLEPVLLREHQELTVMVMDDGNTGSDAYGETLYDIALRKGLIGVADNEPADLSTNPIYLEGFGRDPSKNLG